MIDKNISIQNLNTINRNTLMETLNIEYTEIGENYLCGKMPVNHRTHQPAGLLHGGATAALIESLGSMGSAIIADRNKNNITGIEINVNHIKSVKQGWVFAKAVIIHCGKTTHVWQTDVFDENNRLIATGRLTVLILPKK
jgi:1,4-dihydroxy-2-naphthoyl-CoA hydrolase